MKNTSLSKLHIELGAKIVPFAGFNMPVQYTGVNDEHINVRENVGIFDVSHMGEFIVKGEKATDFLQYITSNDVSKLYDGKVQYSCLPNHNGGIVDDLLIYRISENEYFLVVNASNIEKDWNWIKKHNDFGVEMQDISDDISLLAVQGPKALNVMEKLTEMDLESVKYYAFQKGEIAGVKDVMISTTGYTGAGGFEIYMKNEDAEKIWNAIMEAGQEFKIKPAGLASRDTLRLEMGFCLYGNDIDDSTSPIEAGLGWITKFNKEFINSENLKAQKENGVAKKLIAFELIDRGIPRKDYDIADNDGNIIGKVTSGTMSPSLKKAIGMGYVQSTFSATGAEINIIIRQKSVKAKITTLPFIKS